MSQKLITKRSLISPVGGFASTQFFIGLFTVFGWIGIVVSIAAAMIGLTGLNRGVGEGGLILAETGATLLGMGVTSTLGCFISAEILRLAMRAVIALERMAITGNKSTGPSPTQPPLPPLP